MSKIHDAQMTAAFLPHLPEEVALRWIFERDVEDLTAPSADYMWPYDKERTLKALNHKKRAASAMCNFFLPLFAGRADILLQIIKETSRVTVVKGALNAASVQHVSPAQYQEMRLAASEKVDWYSLPDQLDQWFFHYGDEAVDAFVWKEKTEVIVDDEGNQRSVEVVRPDVYLTGLFKHKPRYHSGIAQRSSSFKEFINHVKPKNTEEIGQAMFNYIHSVGEFKLEDLTEYLRENNIMLTLTGPSEPKAWLSQLPQSCFVGIREAKHTWDSLTPFIAGVSDEKSILKAFNEFLSGGSLRLSTPSEDTNRYVLDSFDQYKELPSADFYDFVPYEMYNLNPVGELSGEQYSEIAPSGRQEAAARHLAYRFSYSWEAACAHASSFPNVDLPHLAFNPYEKFFTVLQQAAVYPWEYAGLQVAARTALKQEYSEVPEYAREAFEMLAYSKPDFFADDSARTVLRSLTKHFTTDEVHEIFIAGAEKRILDNVSASDCESVYERLIGFRRATARTKDNREVDTIFQTSEYYLAIARALRALGTDTKEEAALRRFMRMLVAPRFYERTAHTYFAEAMGHCLDPQDPTGSVHRVLEAADLEGTELGSELVALMALESSAFYGRDSLGQVMIESDSDFRELIISAYQSSQRFVVPGELLGYHAELVVSGKMPINDKSRHILWHNLVMQEVQSALADKPVSAWETFRDLSESWDGSLPDLIATAVAVS